MTSSFEASVGTTRYFGTFHVQDGVLAIIHYHDPARPIPVEAKQAMIRRVCEIQHIENTDRLKISEPADGCMYLKTPPH